MKVIRRTEMELEINELKNAQIGDVLNVDFRSGITAEFAVIGKDADGADTITIQQITKCKASPFNRNDSNEYEGSDAQKYCTGEWLNNLPEGLRSRVVGIPFLLSKEEVKSGEKYPFYKDTRNWLKMNTDGEIQRLLCVVRHPVGRRLRLLRSRQFVRGRSGLCNLSHLIITACRAGRQKKH